MLDSTSTDRVNQLKELLVILADAINEKPGARDLSQLAKQYRETLRELEELEGDKTINDEIGDILSSRKADGKSGSIRKGGPEL